MASSAIQNRVLAEGQRHRPIEPPRASAAGVTLRAPREADAAGNFSRSASMPVVFFSTEDSGAGERPAAAQEAKAAAGHGAASAYHHGIQGLFVISRAQPALNR